MKSVYILCGGFEWKYKAQMKKLAEFILKKYKKPKILDVWFAMVDSEYKEYDDIFVKIYKENNLLYERKVASKENFVNECKWADVINIHGGDTKLLLERMKDYNLEILKRKKIVIGSSAGAIFLSSYNPNWNGKGIREGRKVLPLNIVVHYGDKEYLEDNASWNDVIMALTSSPIGLSVILQEKDIRAFNEDGTEIDI